MRRITMICANQATPNETWTETYTEGAATFGFPRGTKNPEQWARDLVQRFNDTLRSHERPRIVVSVTVTDAPAEKVELAHTWEKTNLVTIMKGNRSYDTAKCTVCGVTAKRFGVGGYTLDPKFKRFEFCPDTETNK